MFQYGISLAWSDEDGGYIAKIPEFPNLSAFGETPEQAVGEAKAAALLMLDVMEEDGEQPPAPRKLSDQKKEPASVRAGALKPARGKNAS